MAACSVCSNPEARKVIDRMLTAGERPATIYREQGERFELSQSAVFRHSRNHAPKSTMTLDWIDGDTSTGDLISDLAGLRRDLLKRHRLQLERGEDASATRTAHEAHAITQTLLKAGHGVEEDDYLAAYIRVVEVTQHAAEIRPDFADEFAAAARTLGHVALAGDLAALASSVRSTQTSRTI